MYRLFKKHIASQHSAVETGGSSHSGGCDATESALKSGELKEMLKEKHDFEYDLVVVGGGSGGLAASKEAALQGLKVACLDFVKPSPIGTTWGLGGTCVNVGCIPKKLMHQAALLGEYMKDAPSYGWELNPESVQHNWETMRQAIQDHIGSLNWGYRVALREKNVKYLNAYGEFVDKHKMKTTTKSGKVQEITSNKFLIATGGRPNYPDIPGVKEYCITSDDLFSLSYSPGKTVVVGASYVALECAGFLHGIGLDVTVMVRSILLRGFDQQCAEKIGDYMSEHGVRFMRPCVPTKIEQLEPPTDSAPGKLRVTATQDGKEVVVECNTVLMAVGRIPCTSGMGLEDVGVQLNKSRFIVADDDEKTNVDNIYALGDVIEGRPELTPVAIQAGRLLARRLAGVSQLRTDYVNVPTTVFTPLEYGACGLAEEVAEEQFGADDIEVYHGNFQPLEWTLPHREENACYAKLVCVKSQNERVVGFHVLGPNAGEITQGFALGMKMGATKADFANTIGIHPTCAEGFTTLSVTKRSGEDIASKGC